MPFVRWQTAVDFLVLTAAIYLLLQWAIRARAVRIALVILGLHAGALLARDYDLVITSWVLTAAGFLAIAVLLLVFQPELRHTFMRLDAAIRSGWRRPRVSAPAHRAIAEAAFSLARVRLGALLVLLRRDTVAELVQGGAAIGAEVSRDLIEAIFQKTSPLHDGAVIVRGNVLLRAGAVLPLTVRPDVPPAFGTRHRAAMGLAERSDALVVVVSEERGSVTLCEDRKVYEIPDPASLADALKELETGTPRPWPTRFGHAITANLRLKAAALGLAAAIWGVAVATGSSSVRVITVPVVLGNVPSNVTVAYQSAGELVVQLNGNPLLMDSAPLARLVATFDLGHVPPGLHTLYVRAGSLDLPPGIRFERSTPPALTIRLERQAAAPSPGKASSKASAPASAP
jgi:diadenylate cyclase